MIKKIKKLALVFSLLGVTVTLSACSPSYESFNLLNIRPTESDFENPQIFIVAPREESKMLTIIYNDSGENIGGSKEVKQKLKDVEITDADIVIETTEETFTFERISESVAVGKNDIQYDLKYPED